MLRKLLIFSLALGASIGFTAGFRSLRGRDARHFRWGAHPAALDAMADACVAAVDRARAAPSPAPAPSPPPAP